GQELPALPPETEVVEDPQEGLGPVQGLAAGLAALTGRAEVSFVSSTDMPFLHPAFVRRELLAVQDGVDVGLPVARGYPQPLADGHRGPEQVLAATVAGAAAAAGLDLDRHVVAALNGDQITRDGETPLAAGDTVFFLSADAGG